MDFSNVAIEAMAYALPPDVVTSEAIEDRLSPLYERLNLPKGRLELMTGIRERRFWSEGFSASQASAEAGNALLGKGVPAKEIDLLIHSAVCRDRLEPATASYVHRLMGLGSNVQILDVSNACLGFLNALILAGGLIESGQIKRAVIVAGENGRPLVDRTIEILNERNLDRQTIKPFFANLTIGAGSVAWSIVHRDLLDDKDAPLIGRGVVETDTSHNDLCEGDSTGDALEMQTDSEELLHAGIAVATRAWDKFSHHTGWTPDTPELIITHQVGRAHTKAVFESIGLDPEKNYSSFETLGNCGSVSLPITYSLACEAGKAMSGHPAAFLGIGSGLSCIIHSVTN
ncbi:MAG: 3-oxoacyl-ACP synthase III [Opitutae bacterium]|nr:3-oxoacyl-ACP synthase III [Opitutae bacterium]MBT5910762.1 3-oxoacyl-ACP synthase III [Opitutae bacterium]MBT6851580.1 3-oxoacyl-ACP synthase III [Opitutae bacterium]